MKKTIFAAIASAIVTGVVVDRLWIGKYKRDMDKAHKAFEASCHQTDEAIKLAQYFQNMAEKALKRENDFLNKQLRSAGLGLTIL